MEMGPKTHTIYGCWDPRSILALLPQTHRRIPTAESPILDTDSTCGVDLKTDHVDLVFGSAQRSGSEPSWVPEASFDAFRGSRR